MKVVPFVLFLVYLQDVICEDAHPQSSKFFVDAYAKKQPKKNVQILISRKFLNKPVPLKTKKPEPGNKGYTVFPAVGTAEKKIFHVPESPYFPIDPNNEQKSRVKKDLPDYIIGAARKKRSAGTTGLKPVENEKEAKKAVKVENAKPSNNTKKVKSKKPKSSGRSLNKTNTKIKTSSKNKNGTNQKSKSLRQKLTKKGVDLKYTKRPPMKNGKEKSKVRRHRLRRRNDKKIHKSVGDTRRLIASRDALIEDYPYVVSIQKNRQHWCAGALLNPRLVITTANCVWKASRVSRLTIRAGSRHTDEGGQQARIQEVMKHPLWSIRKNPDNDVALLLLDRMIKFSHSVHGVDLPNRIMLPAFEDAWVTSWGAERRDGVYDKKAMSLQVYHTRLMNRDKCNNVTQRFGVSVSENFICLAQTGRRAPCTRDTGAPAVSDGVLWGLASWGIRKLCGTERFPAMFSYMASQSNMDFLLNATHYLMADERYYPYPDRFADMQVALPTRPEIPFQ